MTREKENKMEKRYPSKRTNEKETWYRKSPSWMFWDRRNYAELPCINEGCDWKLEVHSPYNSAFTMLSWRAQIVMHGYTCKHQKVKTKKKAAKKPVKKVAKKAVAKKSVKKTVKKNGS